MAATETSPAFALRIGELLADNADLRRDVATVSEMLTATMDALRNLTVRHDKLRDQHQHVKDEYQALRERVCEVSR